MPSTTLKIAQIVCASISCLLSAGIVFGFAAFKRVLVGEKVYQEYCPLGSPSPCTEQDLKLNFIFTLAAGVTNIVSLPAGWVLDHYGPRFSAIVGAVWIAIGAAMYVWSAWLYSSVDPYMLGYIMFAIGGPFVFVASFQLANTFPKRSGSVLALITGSFDCSSALFLVYRLLYQRSDGRFRPSSFFAIYMVVPLLIVVSQLTMMPKSSYMTQGAVEKLSVEHLDENGQLLEGDSGSTFCPDEDERRSLMHREAVERNEEVRTPNAKRRKSVLEEYVERRLQKKSGGMFGMMHRQPLRDQIANPLFYLMVTFVTVCMLRINYFVATVRSQEEYLLGDPELALKMNSIFDVALPLGGVVAVPLAGLILDNMEGFDVLVALFGSSVTVGVLGLVPASFTVQLLGILFLVVYRPFLYTVLTDYICKVFGFDTFGTLYGLLICVSGAFNIMQSVLDKLTHTTFKMNPTPLNAVLVLCTVLSGSALLWRVRQQLGRPVAAAPAATLYNSV